MTEKIDEQTGTVEWDENTYDVTWIEKDLVDISLDGNSVAQIASSKSGGFENIEDVLDQVWDFLSEDDFDVDYWEDDFE